MRTALPGLSEAEAGQVAEQHYRLLVELWWGRFRGLKKFGWQPEIALEGRVHLDAARDCGQGVVLWCSRFADNAVFLRGLWQHGVPVVHLSNEAHGSPDRSRFGVRCAGRLYRQAEDPYVAERVEIPRDGSLGYMRVLLERLRDRAVLSIVGENRGRQNIPGTLLGREVQFASGAPALAWTSGAALLTAHVIRVAPFHYRVLIEPAVDADRTVGRRAFVQEAVGEFLRRLERMVTRHPSDWLAWTREAPRPVR